MDPKVNALIKKLQELDFALTDVALYLNSHPTCQHGLAYFHKYHKMRKDVASELHELSPDTPLTINEMCSTTRWTWADDPWPWEIQSAKEGK